MLSLQIRLSRRPWGIFSMISRNIWPWKGDDDFFSSDLSEDRLTEIWQHAAWNDVPVMVIYSDEDQYVPDFVDKVSMVQRWETIYRSKRKEALPRGSHFEVLPYANHEIADPMSSDPSIEVLSRIRAQVRMCSLVISFLQKTRIHSERNANFNREKA
jgi:Protein of unknown function (DUF1749)